MRFIRRMPSSKSPPSTAVIAAISRFPTAWPARPPVARLRGGSGKRYWRTSLISGSASARAAMQLRMSPTGGIPSSVAQHARRAAVVGDGHDRGQVAGVLLEAAQEGRQAGPAADRDDPRPAGEEALLVDELDERLVRRRAPGAGRSGPERPGTTRRRRARRRPTATMSPRNANGRNWSVSESIRPPTSPLGARSRVIWRRKWATARASRSRPANTTSSQRLTPMPGVSQRRQVHVRSSSRWKTATGPKSWFAQPARQLLGDDDRAVVAAGAADGDRQPRLALGDVGRDREVEELVEELEEAAGDGLVEDERADLVGQPGQRAELRRRSTGSA